MNRRNSALSDTLRPVPKLDVGGWAWVSNTSANIRQGTKPDPDTKVFKTELSLNWTAPYKVLADGPCSSADTPGGSPLGTKLLYLDLPSDMPGTDARRRVSVQRCKPCATPHDRGDIPKHLPAGLTQIRAQQLLQENSPVTRHPGRRFDPSLTTRSGKYYQTPIG